MLLFVPVLLQFERFCRPYYTAGFNAYELVEAAMVSRRAETVGEYKPAHSAAAQPDSRALLAAVQQQQHGALQRC